LKRQWHIFKILRAQKEKRLPCVLSKSEIDAILNHVRTIHNKVFLTTVYSCGLRLQESLYLQVFDIDGERMQIHVHRGKGAKDRYVPLPEETLFLLRDYWVMHRNPTLFFPAIGRGQNLASISKIPMAIDSVQGTLRKAIEAIVDCRSGAYGFTVYECEECGEQHYINRSCGNRHCPTCQNGKALQRLERQLENQLPGHHFMLTFTVPECVRDFIRRNQRLAYRALFKASAESMKKLAADERHIGGDLPGFTGILHTWGRQLQYHPHIHYIAPGGAFGRKDGNWHCSRLDFYLPVKALSKIYRAKFRDAMKIEGLLHLIDPKAWEIDWNVNVQAVASGTSTVKYLSLYVFKVGISDHRIESFENGRVTFRYRKTGSNRDRKITLIAEEFIRRYLQHVLPSGFMKVRRYGFINPNSSVCLDTVKALIAN
jgi:hypothetical protein